MPRSATTGVFARVNNSFSNPVFGTLIDPTDALALFVDQDDGLNPANLAGPLNIIAATTLGKAGTTVGTLGFFNATSGSITIAPPTGALGTVTMTLPDATDTFVGKATTDNLTNKTYNKVTITPPATSATLTLIDGTVVTGPATTDTLVGRATTDTLTNKTLTNPAINGATILTSTYNKVTITAPATSATLTLIDGTTLTGPAASGTVMTLGNTETVTGVKTFGSAGAVGRLKVAGTTSGSTVLDATAIASGTLTLPAATDTLIGKATTDILTNKTIDTAGTGNHIQISGVDITRGQILGESTTGSASAGNIGEYVVSTVTSGSPVSLTTSVVANMTSISLTAGDWDVFFTPNYQGAGTTTVSFLENSISLTTATQDRTENRMGSIFYNNLAIFGTIISAPVPCGPVRLSLSSTTTVFGVVRATFATSTLTVYGTLRARRVR